MKATERKTKILSNKNILLLVGICSLSLTGCNTMEGVGTDIKHAGQALEHSLEKAREDCRPCPCCSHPTPSHRH